MRGGAAAAVGITVLAAAGVALTLWAQQGSAPQPARAAYDRIAKAVTGEDPQRRCYTDVRQSDGSIVGHYVGSRACHDFLAPRRFTGVYVDEFEGQMFLEGAGVAERYVIPCRWIWLTVDEKSDVRRWARPKDGGNLSRVWLLDFVGRATPPAPNSHNGYGHMGVFEGEVLVDQVISARLIGSYEGYSHAGPGALVTRKEDCPIA